MKISKSVKQYNIGKGWGYMMQIIQQEAVVIQGIILISSLITASSVLQIRGYEIPLWVFLALAGTLIILGGIGIFIMGMPSYFSAFNDQFWKHNNPMREKMELMESNQKKIMEKLGIKDDN
jgi:hypothetical protein